jgi:hypothetical protein
MKRLQGATWHLVKENVTIEGYIASSNGNICIVGTKNDTNEKVYHWLNENEKKDFNTEETIEFTWEEIFGNKK